MLTAGGYVKRTNPEEYRKQKRGGVGVIDLDTKEEDFVTTFLTHLDPQRPPVLYRPRQGLSNQDL